MAGGSMASIRTPVPDDLQVAVPSMTVIGDWVLGDRGKQYLAWAEGGVARVNLEAGRYAVKWIDPKTGKVTDGSGVKGGGTVELRGAGVAWIARGKE